MPRSFALKALLPGPRFDQRALDSEVFIREKLLSERLSDNQ
jgi:hypothetical protein